MRACIIAHPPVAKVNGSFWPVICISPAGSFGPRWKYTVGKGKVGNPVVSYIIRRFIGIAITLLLLTLLTFVLTRSVPGTPWGNNAYIPLTPDQEAVFRAKYGMDKPVWEQYLVWLRNAIMLDFGTPFTAPDLSVTQLIAKALPYSALIGGFAATLTLLIGIPLGMIAAAHQDSTLDNIITDILYGVIDPRVRTAGGRS